MSDLYYVLPWVLACVLVGLGVGFYMGRTLRQRRLAAPAVPPEETMRVLSSILVAAEQLNQEVDSHNSEIEEVGRSLVDMQVDEAYRGVQHRLLTQIASVLEANHRLEDDLNYARLRIEEQAQEIDRTRKEARMDALSGVPNRKGFDEKLQMMLGAWRRERRPLVLAICDVDHFKWINDTHGHAAGDRVVAGIGDYLRSALRDEDYVARFGGDEFCVLLPIDLPSGKRIVERIHANLAKKNFGIRTESEQAAVTFSIGMTGVLDNDTPETIFQRADQALYRSKETGRNCINCFEENDASRPMGRRDQEAVEEQPTVEAATA